MINWKKIGRIAVWVVFIAGTIIVLASTRTARNNSKCVAINISIDSTTNDLFVTKDIVKGILYNAEGELIGKAVKEVNINKIEKSILENPYVLSAVAYMDINGILNIEVKQRRPIVRFLNYFENESFYFDEQGKIMKTCEEYTARVPLVLCDSSFRHPDRIENQVKIFPGDTLEKKSIVSQVFVLAQFLDRNPFWNAQIDQIVLSDKNEIRLIPRMGDHEIVLGTMENYQEKFANLLLFYKKGINTAGWNTYKEINLKYNNQIVCQKK